MLGLHVFHDGWNWVVAASAEEAVKAYAEHIGDDICPDEDGGAPEHWKQLSDEVTIEIWCDEDGSITEVEADGAEPVGRTCAAWIARNGWGFLCSTEG